MLPDMLNPKHLYQKGFLYIVVISMNMVSIASGTIFTWASPSIPKLQTLFDLTTGQIAAISSFHFMGAIFGTTIILTFIKRLGKRLLTAALALFLVVGYLILAFANHYYLFLLGRFLCGISLGSFFQIAPVYVGEVSKIKNRGIMGCLQSIFLVLGQVYTFSIGPFVSYQTLCLYLMLPAVIFIMLAVFVMPESPYDCIARGDEEGAKSVLKKLRYGESESEIGVELERIVEDLSALNEGVSLMDIFWVKPLRKSLLINASLILLQQFSGINALTGYMQLIFTWSGVDISPGLSPLYVVSIQFLTALTIPFYVETAGRKLILFVSQLFITFSLGGLGVYFYLKSHNLSLPFFWLPITCLIIFFVAFNVGLGCIPYVLVGEIFPQNAKRIACTMMVCLSGTVGFISTWLFPILIEAIGSDATFWILTGLSGAGIIVIYVLVPETKMKSFQEIQEMLS